MDSLSSLIRAVKNTDLIVTPRLQKFLMNSPNLELDEWVVEIIAEQLQKKQRDRRFSFSSSSAGQCERKQVFTYMGLPHGEVNSPQQQLIFFDGTWRHLRLQAILLQARIIDSIENSLKWKAQKSMGSMDGMGTVPDTHSRKEWVGKEFGLEIKGMNSWGYKSAVANGVKEGHLDQINRYFLSSGLELFVVIYENKDTQEWTEWVITPDKKRMENQRQELLRLNLAVDTKKLPKPIGECLARKGSQWKYCQFAGKNGKCETLKTYDQVQQMIDNPQEED